MVYGMAKQLGGTVRLRSEPGRGTAVAIYLPRFVGKPLRRTPISVAVDRSVSAGRPVLLAEDDRDVREVTAALLRARGYTVLEAEGGPAALAMLDADPGADIEALVADVVMPEMSGPELAAAARRRRPGLPVLLITGYGEPEAIGRDATGCALLHKPYKPDELAAALAGCIRQPPADDKSARLELTAKGS
jgi:CheY-like chemotaxis protein